MTQHQLEELTEDELALLFFIVNVASPIDCPKMEFDKNSIKWFRHDMLVKKILDVFPKLNREGHATYSSLLKKLGAYVEIKYEAPPTASVATSPETSSVIPPPPTEVTASVAEAPQTGSTV